MFLGKRTNGYYFVEFFDKSLAKVRRVSTGTTNKFKAAKFASQFDNIIIEEPSTPIITLKQYQIEYEKFIGSNHSKKYLSSIQMCFRQLINYCGNIPVDKINLRLAQQFISDTYNRTKHGASLSNRTLKAAYNVAMEWEYISENPFKKVRLPKIEKSAPLFITEEELQKILDNTIREDLKKLFQFAFYTGMRLGEIINLRWSAIDMNSKVIQVMNTHDFKTKSKKERVVPIGNKLFNVLLLEKCECSNDYVFPKCKGVKLNGDHTSKVFKDAVLKAKLNNKIHFHTLRHSFASKLVQQGASLYVVKELLGHSDITVTQVYSHLQINNLVDAIRLLD